MKLHNKFVSFDKHSHIFDVQTDGIFPYWEAGAADNIFLHHSVLECPKDVVDELVHDIEQLAFGLTDCGERIRKTFRRWRTVHLIDQLIGNLLENSSKFPVKPYLYDFVFAMAFESTEPEEIKAGIALLGIIGCDSDDIYKLKYMARCEEYTAFVVMTLNALLEDADSHIWELAQNTQGWGRINSIEQLRSTTDIRIKDWLLYEGYNNTIGNEYTALICAQAGNLANELATDTISVRLLDCAADIINALLKDDYAGGIDDYSEAYAACSDYVRHVAQHMYGLSHYALLIRLAKYIKNPMANIAKRTLCGWRDAETAQLYSQITKLLRDKSFTQQVLAVLDTEDGDDSLTASNYLGFDRWAANWRRLCSNPLNPAYWREIFRLLNSDRAEMVAEYIKESECWVEFTSDTESDSYCHLALDEILAGISAYPGMGADLLPHTLSSALQRHRRATLSVLGAWDKSCWPKNMNKMLRAALKKEKSKSLQAKIERLLS